MKSGVRVKQTSWVAVREAESQMASWRYFGYFRGQAFPYRGSDLAHHALSERTLRA